MVTKITVVDARHAFGYHHPDDFGMAGQDETFRKMIWVHDLCNAASIVLSPLVAIACSDCGRYAD